MNKIKEGEEGTVREGERDQRETEGLQADKINKGRKKK